MSYPTSYAPYCAGEWKNGEMPISDKYLMHVKHDSKNYLYIVDEFNRSDFLDWVLQTFGSEEAFEHWLNAPCNSAFYNEFTHNWSEGIEDYLTREGISVTQIYLADLIKLSELKIKRI